MIFKFHGPPKSERQQVHPHHWLADPGCGMLLMRRAINGCRTSSALHPARRPVANEAKYLKRSPMITLRRKMDDGEGNVYIVQQGSFTRLAAFIHRLNKDQGLHINPQLDTAGFEALIQAMLSWPARCRPGFMSIYPLNWIFTPSAPPRKWARRWMPGKSGGTRMPAKGR